MLIIGITLLTVALQLLIHVFGRKRYKHLILGVLLLIMGNTLIFIEISYTKLYSATEIQYVATSLPIHGEKIMFAPEVLVHESYYDTPWFFILGGRQVSTYTITPEVKTK